MIEGAGVAWYSPETYRRLQAAAGDVLCTYDEFVQKTEWLIRGGATLVAHGGEPFDVNLPVEGADFLRSQ